jgi:Spy/CpxP family protein refolding chaperone
MENSKVTLIETRRFGMRSMLAALIAGSIAMTAGGLAYADNKAPDPARFQEHIQKRVDKALTGTDVTDAQKTKVADILKAAFTDMKPLFEKGMQNRKAMEAAMQAPTIDRAQLEKIRTDELQIQDARSKRFTQALADAGDVLSASQRQAFFKNWSNHEHRAHHGDKKPG